MRLYIFTHKMEKEKIKIETGAGSDFVLALKSCKYKYLNLLQSFIYCKSLHNLQGFLS